MARSMSSKARMSKSMKSKSMSKGKKGRRGGCGQSPLTMYGGNAAPVAPVAAEVLGYGGTPKWADSSALVGGSPLSPATLDGQMGGRSRRFRKSRKSRKMNTMKVFPNNIFRNMF